jgi:hypothetical protein
MAAGRKTGMNRLSGVDALLCVREKMKQVI